MIFPASLSQSKRLGKPTQFPVMPVGGATWYSGLTDLVAVYQPKGAASLAASYVNLVNPGTFDAAPGVAPTWDAATGWTFNGTTQYLITGIIAGAGYSAIARFSNNTSVAFGCLLGAYSSPTNRFEIIPLVSADRGYSSGGIIRLSPPATGGNMAISGTRGYLNGIDEGLSMPGTGTTVALDIARRAGLNDGLYSGNVQAVAICSSPQSADQIAAASAAMAAL